MVTRALHIDFYEKIIKHLPTREICCAFAYGSGVFQQKNHPNMKKNMLDFIVVVNDSYSWHKRNMLWNPTHYSALKHLGANRVANVQDNYGAGVYFNTLVPCEGRLIKYGVLNHDTLLNDLLDWETLYVAGRLHKPVCMIKGPGVTGASSPELRNALNTNLHSAMHCALLVLDDRFTEEELYLTITGLSYSGDLRMKVGEDKNKITNIVRPHMDKFRELYESTLDADPHLNWNKSKGEFSQNVESESRYHHLNLLPRKLTETIVLAKSRDGRLRDTEEVIHHLAHDAEETSEVIQSCVAQIVQRSSTSQSLKGILTAGLVKSAQYSYAKLNKMWKSKKQKK